MEPCVYLYRMENRHIGAHTAALEGQRPYLGGTAVLSIINTADKLLLFLPYRMKT